MEKKYEDIDRKEVRKLKDQRIEEWKEELWEGVKRIREFEEDEEWQRQQRKRLKLEEPSEESVFSGSD